jgi:hypothetical protein
MKPRRHRMSMIARHRATISMTDSVEIHPAELSGTQDRIGNLTLARSSDSAAIHYICRISPRSGRTRLMRTWTPVRVHRSYIRFHPEYRDA